MMKWISFFCFIYVTMVENMLRPTFQKKKSTNNFQMNLEKKNEILNGSIYHYMIYILISH